MPYVLRDYQVDASTRGAAFLRGTDGRAGGGLIVLPTGAGKSLVIADIASRLDGPCLIFQPSSEILEQNANKIASYGYQPSVYSASMRTREVGSITLATIGSVKGRPDLFDAFPYVMVDEAHGVNPKQGMYKDFIESLGDVRVLGLTASPYRLSKDSYGGSQLKFLTRTRPTAFKHMVAYAQIPDLIARGYLVKPEYQVVPGFKGSEVKLNTSGGDYDELALKRYYNRTNFHDRLRRVILRLLEIGRKNILVFTRFVDEAMDLVQQVPGCACLSSETKPSHRKAIVNGFRSGEIKVVANVGVLGIGFDYPELETVVLARPTVSLALYYQQVGRLMRPHPLKQSAWVVDMVDQVAQFGKIEDLWLQPAGTKASMWEMVTNINGIEVTLTNKYFGGGPRRKTGAKFDRFGRFIKRKW